MCCSRFIGWMNKRFNEGIFKKLSAKPVNYYVDEISLNAHFRRYVKKQLNTETAPPGFLNFIIV